MRELKFRAYYKGKMYPVATPEYTKLFNKKIYFADGFIDDYYTEGKVELMQYTGLKDKKGKEIYEGDIISDGQDNRVVEYDYNAFITTRKFSYLGKKTRDTTTMAFNLVRVVGNIYENPELLKEKNKSL